MAKVPNPGTPYMKMWIGAEEVTRSRDRRLLSFNYDMAGNKNGTIDVKFLDVNFNHIERLIDNNWENVTFQFGWPDAKDKSLWSDLHTMIIYKYKPEIFDSYCILTVHGETKDPSIQNSNPQTEVVKQLGYAVIEQTSVAAIVKQIFEERKYKVGLVEDTAEFPLVQNSVDQTLSIPPVMYAASQTELQFFLNDLLFKAIDKEHADDPLVEENNGKITGGSQARGGYYLYFVNSDPPQVGLTYKGKASKATFTYPEPPYADREVLRFSYEQDVMATASLGQQSERSTGTEILSGMGITLRSDAYTIKDAATGTKTLDPTSTDGVVGAANVMPANSRNVREWAAAVQGRYWAKELQIDSSSLTIFGRPDILIGHLIEMKVMMNKGYQSWGGANQASEPHYTSGSWEVWEVHHTITPGIFETTLGMKKMSGKTFHKTPQTGGKLPAYVDGMFRHAYDANPPNNTEAVPNYFKAKK